MKRHDHKWIPWVRPTLTMTPEDSYIWMRLGWDGPRKNWAVHAKEYAESDAWPEAIDYSITAESARLRTVRRKIQLQEKEFHGACDV